MRTTLRKKKQKNLKSKKLRCVKYYGSWHHLNLTNLQFRNRNINYYPIVVLISDRKFISTPELGASDPIKKKKY